MISKSKSFKRSGALFMVGTVLGTSSTAAYAQATPPAAAAPAPAPAVVVPGAPQAQSTIRSISVRGNQRLEPDTIRAYANLQPGQNYTAQTLDQSLKDLYATQLFADVQIGGADTGDLVISVRENPVINRIVLEGNKRLKDDKILPEIRLAPRQIFTRSSARSDVDRILELYRRQGRFAAQVEPKIVQLDQNRVDVVFEIFEGDLAKVRQINIIGNQQYDDGRLQKEMFTREAGGLLGFMKSNDTYDPDRLAADQQKLRSFYLTEGYADFRVVSALAELTPDRRDFVITYVVEEGERYKFGTVGVDSALRDLPESTVQSIVRVKPGQWFNAKTVEDDVTNLNEAAGNRGYAFADINPGYERDAEKKLMNVTFKIGNTPRVYVERIDITGNTITRDKVIRREFRLNEGDAFNAIRLKRSQDRIQSLGFFQENLEVKQTEGSGPDRVVLGLNVEEKPTGQLSVSGGYSSLERFVLQLAVAQNNFMGKGQQLDAQVNWSRYARSVQLGFVEPYFLDKPILLGGTIYRRDYNSFNILEDGQRNRTYSQVSTGLAMRTGFPINEYVTFGGRYSLVNDKITLDRDTFYSDLDGDGVVEGNECDPLRAGQYLCDEIGSRVTSSIGWSTVYDSTNGVRPTRGSRIVLSQDLAGLGGDVKYLRSRGEAVRYKSLGRGFVFSLRGEGGYIHPGTESPGPGRDPIRITDRFFGPQLRGFDIRGIGPRIQRIPYDLQGNPQPEESRITDALGGRAFYMARAEVEFPINQTLRSFGLRPSAFVDAGSLWNLTTPQLTNVIATCVPVLENTTGTAFQIKPTGTPTTCGPTSGVNGFTRVAGFQEVYLGDSPKPRVSIGIGVNWTSPFGPLRIDLARALMKQEGDDTKLFSFNVGTSF